MSVVSKILSLAAWISAVGVIAGGATWATGTTQVILDSDLPPYLGKQAFVDAMKPVKDLTDTVKQLQMDQRSLQQDRKEDRRDLDIMRLETLSQSLEQAKQDNAQHPSPTTKRSIDLYERLIGQIQKRVTDIETAAGR